MVNFTIEVTDDDAAEVMATVSGTINEGESQTFTVTVEDPSPQASISGN